MIRIGKFFFRYRDFLFPAYFAALAVAIPPVLAGHSVSTDVWVDLFGVAFAATGQCLRAAVIGYVYIKRGGKDKQVYADSLVVDGFFAHSRNPLYVGNVMVLVGLSIIHGSPIFIGLCLVFYGFAYWAIVLTEEDYLRQKFGAEYTAYCQRVNRFIPQLAGLRTTVSGMKYDWRRVVRKEYGSAFTWILAAIVMMIYERLYYFDLPDVQISVYSLSVLVIPMFAAYVTARLLKKTKRLGRD